MTEAFSIVGSIVPYLLLISVVVTVHELGHYLAGRSFGAAVESFALGFGRPVFEVSDRRGTRWRLNWLPLGGFVKFVGESQMAGDVGRVEAGPVGKVFTDLAPGQRLVVALAGPFANFVFASVLFAAFSMTLGVPEVREVRVAGVTERSPAAEAGFQPGDVVVRAGGRKVVSEFDLIVETKINGGARTAYVVMRDGQQLTLVARPEVVEERNPVLGTVEKVGRIGISLSTVDGQVRRYGAVEALGYGCSETLRTIAMTARVLGRIVTGQGGLDQMRGPLGMADISDKLMDSQLKRTDVPFADRLLNATINFLSLAALFSVGVGFFNLLPIPVLDGGAALMCVVEMASRREIPERVQRIGLTIGLACLVVFLGVITWNDVVRPGGQLEVLRGMLS